MFLSDLKKGDRGKILKIGGSGVYKRRLSDMGLLKGEIFTVKNIAPLGDPIEITIKDYNLSLRKNEAQNIEVEKIKEKNNEE